MILGHRNSGKSAQGWWLAEQAHERKRPTAAYGLPNAAQRVIPRWVKPIQRLDELASLKPSLVLLDESALSFNARRSQSQDNLDLNKIIAVARHKGHGLVFISQHSRQIDVGIVTEADIVLFKQPSLLHVRFARPELRPEVEAAYTAFQHLRGERAAYCYAASYHTGAQGMLKSQLPSFWTDKLSKSFASLDVAPAKPKRTLP